MHMHHMLPYMCLDVCMLNMLCYNLISLARIVMLSMCYFDIVSVLACHTICILFVCVNWTHSLPFLHFCHLSYVSILIHDLPFIIMHIH